MLFAAVLSFISYPARHVISGRKFSLPKKINISIIKSFIQNILCGLANFQHGTFGTECSAQGMISTVIVQHKNVRHNEKSAYK